MLYRCAAMLSAIEVICAAEKAPGSAIELGVGGGLPPDRPSSCSFSVAAQN
jgi:hypothetical protein